MLNDGADRITQAQDGADGTYVLFTTSGHVSRHHNYFSAKDYHDRELPDDWACIARGGKALGFLQPHGRETLAAFFASCNGAPGRVRGHGDMWLACSAQSAQRGPFRPRRAA